MEYCLVWVFLCCVWSFKESLSLSFPMLAGNTSWVKGFCWCRNQTDAWRLLYVQLNRCLLYVSSGKSQWVGVYAPETLVLLHGILLMCVIHVKFVPGLAVRFQYSLTYINIAADRGARGLCCPSVLIWRQICFSKVWTFIWCPLELPVVARGR